MSFSHRDRRTHRTVKRGLAWVAGTVAALCLLAVALPGSWGMVGVAALAVSGAAYLVWSEAVLSEYASDLRAASEAGTARGFLRAEVAGVVGLERTVGRPTERSPNTRPRPRPLLPSEPKRPA
jgi:hypothetical protein